MPIRPSHLPDFERPPLDEVVLGVQFAPAPNFTSVHIRDVWDLYKDRFPRVQDHMRLPPLFETFGGMPSQHIGFPPVFMAGQQGAGGRVWFISENENELLQFQPDRFLTNWRRGPNEQPYPRFEVISELYESNISKLSTLFMDLFSHELRINQAEVTYINIMPVSSFSEATKYFVNWKYSTPAVEGLNITAVEIIQDENLRPYARLIQEIQSAFSSDARRVYKMSLTFRGRPAGQSKDDAMKFLAKGREAIVLKFKELTTKRAHKRWGINQ
jgi:uncharacterized protein (TIGR04255 family)